MNQIIANTLGGLNTQYYIRQFILGLMFPALMYFLYTQGQQEPLPFYIFFVWALNAFLYPYARFVYEAIVHFVIGENVFYINALLLMIAKFITMSLCWSFAVVIAPFGFVFLYFYHQKKETN